MKILQNIFNRKEPVKQIIKGKSDYEIVEAVHAEFYTASDELLKEANKWLEEANSKDTNKGQRLAALGFTNMKEAKEASELEQEKMRVKRDCEIINNLSVKFPAYKVISEYMVKEICGRYGLLFSNVSNYIGEVPEKNLDNIEKFSKLPMFGKKWIYATKVKGNPYSTKSEEISEEEYHKRLKEVKENEAEYEYEYNYGVTCNYCWIKKGTNQGVIIHEQPAYFPSYNLSICAPEKDFRKSYAMTVREGFKLDYDPIVLFEAERGYYVIVDAWGPEAQDKDVVNQKMN